LAKEVGLGREGYGSFFKGEEFKEIE